MQWICTQNKVLLVNVDLITQIFREETVVGCYVGDRRIHLGIYRTREQTQKVFDDITKWLSGYDGEVPFYDNDYVYHMPED